jgi:hypothetical protein
MCKMMRLLLILIQNRVLARVGHLSDTVSNVQDARNRPGT